ncbi:MAG: DUF1553 domain-containing protein [Planctomycetes bacterium]|nr:DUF1553 domain-containing protein [Planctomycetota bacterium]
MADWLTSPKNPYFARNLANRIWLHLLGKGLADPPEQLHEMSLTANNELLDFLASELIAHRFDARPIIRLIMNSRVYQLSSERNAFNQDDEKYFSRSYGAALQSEVLVDVLNQFLELPSEPDGLPPGTRALRMFDERVHWIGFSRPQRLSVCEAEIERNLASHVHTLHSEWMQARLKAPYNRLGRLLAEKRSDREILDELFMTAFARLPTDEARRSAAAHLAKAKNRREAFEDIVWAIVNTKEFAWRP